MTLWISVNFYYIADFSIYGSFYFTMKMAKNTEGTQNERKRKKMS